MHLPDPPLIDAATPTDEIAVAMSLDLLQIACHCLSAAMQLDYLSTTAGHRQSRASFAGGRRRTVARAASKPAAAPAVDVDGADESATTPATTTSDIAGRYLDEVARRERLTSSEEYRLASLARAGCARARRQLAEHNLGLVVMIARRYAHGAIPLLDLIQEGNLGLMTACERFDPELGFRLSTYAKWWIRQAIELMLMTQSHAVRIPAHAARSLKRAQKQAGPEEAGDEAADTVQHPGRYLLFDATHASHGEPAEDGSTVLDTLCAPSDDEPDALLRATQLHRRLGDLLSGLRENERHVISRRYGLGDDEVQTLACIAQQLSLSCERVRQIEGEALARLRVLADSHGVVAAHLF